MHKKRLIGILITAAPLFGIVLVALVWAFIWNAGKRMTDDERQNELVVPLMNAKEVTLAFQRGSEEEVPRTLTKSDRELLIDCLDDATLEPNALKWIHVGTITLNGEDGGKVEWHLYEVSSGELAYRPKKGRYWRGVRPSRIAELVDKNSI
jgi:hypothetical protein